MSDVVSRRCERIYSDLVGRSAPGWRIKEPTERLDAYKDKYCIVDVLNTTLRRGGDELDDDAPWATGVILDAGFSLEADIPLGSEGAYHRWAEKMKACGCDPVYYHFHVYNDRGGHFWTEADEPENRPSALLDGEQNYNKAYHGHVACPKDSRRCVVDSVLKET